ncbi:MAG: hypothetical protein IKC79_01180 [Clostridia bacterium]|nr:hypothetical protein [Clostridia bacterium]
MFALLADFWNDLLNTLFRQVAPTTKGIIIAVAFLLGFLFLSKALSVGKKHAEKPINWGILLLAVLCFVVAILYITI